MKKYISEFIGTAILVIFGCGSAVAANTLLGNAGYFTPLAFSTLLIAFAFGLAVMACIHIFGSVSGCHINPAISLAVWMNNKMSTKDFIFYLVSQFLGGIVGALILWVIFNSNASLGANGFGSLSALNVSMFRAMIVEIILTFLFVLTVLVVTSKEETKKIAPFAIGFALVSAHILGIPFTGTSVNPARSLGPALITGGKALSQVWVFILAPLAGAVIASIVYRFVIEVKQVKKSEVKTTEVKEVKKETKPTQKKKKK